MNKISDKRKQYSRQIYIARINRVLDYIENNIGESLDLDKLSQIASFSKFHFHRLFSVLIGETLNSFIKRLRIEKAASMLMNNSKVTITSIALYCGFSSSQTFSRAFKEYFNMSASEFRNGGYKKISKNRKMKSKNWEDKYVSSGYIQDKILRERRLDKMEAKVQVKDMPELHVAYIRHIGSFKGNAKLFEKLFGKLKKWAGPRGLIRFPETKVIAVYHDDPKITDEDKLRLSTCITIPEDTEVDGEIGKMTVSGGKYAVARFEIRGDQYDEAWEAVIGGWLPGSGYQPDDRSCYEHYINDPKEHPKNIHIVDFYYPVKPL